MTSLILTCQVVPPPGNDLIFQFDKHSLPITHACIGGDNDSLVFTLSNKLILFNMSTVSDLGEIELTKDEKESFNFFVAYTLDDATNVSLKELAGGFVVATRKQLKSYDFDSTLRFCQNFETKTILELFFVSIYSLFFYFLKNVIYFSFWLYFS